MYSTLVYRVAVLLDLKLYISIIVANIILIPKPNYLYSVAEDYNNIVYKSYNISIIDKYYTTSNIGILDPLVLYLIAIRAF